MKRIRTMNINKDSPRFQFFILNLMCFLTILSIIVIGVIFIHPFLSVVPINDGHKYYFMAEINLMQGGIPFRYRILTPLLVAILPVETLIGFIIVNLTGFYATSLLFYYFLRKIGFSFTISLSGVFLFIISPVNIFLLQHICFVEFLTFFFFLLALYALLDSNKKLFLISVTIGTANKETLLITLVLFFYLELKEKDLRSSILSTLLISIPPISVFLIIRYTMHFIAVYYSHITIIITLQRHLNVININIFFHPYMFYLTFGVLWLISFLYFYSKKIENPFLKKSIILLPFIFLQGFFAIDYTRPIFIAFPIIIPISLYLLKNPLQRKYLILILIITLILLISQIIGPLYFFRSTPKIIIEFESYVYYVLLSSLFTIYLMLILVYLLFKDLKIRNSEENEINLENRNKNSIT
ncbi:MAG: hypothetical protein EU529_13840 [Promethearchaeota archaeon]|nr:MAG: hypothetical protein EU529_13840 [Candidatus Lokiarchaeota archaeon]